MILRKVEESPKCLGGGDLAPHKSKRHNKRTNFLHNKFIPGFTLAEVLLTMTIIGIIAAMTIPVLMTSVSKTETETRLKKAYSTFAQAMQLVEAGERRPLMSYYTGSSVASVTKVKTKLKKYLSSTDISTSDTWTYSGTLSDGIIFELDGGYSDDYIVLWIDINGAAEPNSIGYDRFYFAMSKNSYIKDHPNVKQLDSYWRVRFPDTDATSSTLKSACSSNTQYCSAYIMNNGWEIPDDYPLDI
ncbi:MAG: type II secretion system GspH family protein [Candidatus Gastranaerophilales bacterium]|nr:type II secretion system GspH family protein [Candidatus Gastranaerophilales bacterium]